MTKLRDTLQLRLQLGLQFYFLRIPIKHYFCFEMRNTTLKDKRDRMMVKKFYELYDVKRMRMDDVLLELSVDWFFLTTDYIYGRIFYDKKNSTYYEELLVNNK